MGYLLKILGRLNLDGQTAAAVKSNDQFEVQRNLAED